MKVQREMRRYVNSTDTPFPSLIGLRIDIPHFHWCRDERRARKLYQKFIPKLINAPSLRYLYINDVNFEEDYDDDREIAAPPLPSIPSSVVVGLSLYAGPSYLKRDLHGRLGYYTDLIPNLITLWTNISLRSSEDMPAAWRSSVQRFCRWDYRSEDGFRHLLEVIRLYSSSSLYVSDPHFRLVFRLAF